jgi:hypothetical protein
MAETAPVWLKATWEQVKPDDVILMPAISLTEIVQAKVLDVRGEDEQDDSRRLVYASLEWMDTVFPRWSFDPRATVYVKARF